MNTSKKILGIISMIIILLSIVIIANNTFRIKTAYADIPGISNLSAYFPRTGQDPASVLTKLHGLVGGNTY